MAKIEKKVKEDKFRKITIDTFFNFEADGIDIASSQVKPIHNSGNIHSSGTQLEVSIRNFFIKKLPEKYYITEGHIVDSELNCSSQIDLLIADGFKTPILYKTYDGTEYLTYESVYAYAEIKSTWNKKYLSSFIKTAEKIDIGLRRDKIGPNFINAGGKGFQLDVPTTRNPFQNPLLKFMFITSSESFDFKHVRDIYKTTPYKYLPNILCLFDKGLIVNINKQALDNDEFRINLYPEFCKEGETDDNEWVLLELDKKRSTLGTLYYLVLEHLNSTVLATPQMINYMSQIFDLNVDNINPLNDY